jgi:alpha-L-fucosidase
VISHALWQRGFSPATAGFSLAATLLAALLAVTPAAAQAKYTPAPENLKAREWFQDAKFGLFIHWGVYSVLGDG